MSVLFSLLWVVHEALKIQMKNSFWSSYFSSVIASEIPLLPRVQVSPTAASIPMRSRCLGAVAQAEAGNAAGVWIQEGPDKRVRMGPSVSSLLGQWQGRALGVPPAGQLSTAALCRSTSTHGCLAHQAQLLISHHTGCPSSCPSLLHWMQST